MESDIKIKAAVKTLRNILWFPDLVPVSIIAPLSPHVRRHFSAKPILFAVNSPPVSFKNQKKPACILKLKRASLQNRFRTDP
jgi:hypothetical protein